MLVTRSQTIAEQVNDLLRTRIRDGTYAPGDRLPSESDLSDELGVSRATIRTAMAKLASNGLILRKQGDGTYVNERLQEVNAQGGLWEFGSLIQNNGSEPTILSLETTFKSAEPSEAALLNLQPGDEVLLLRRLFKADNQPVILATNVLPGALITERNGTFDAQLPIGEFLQQYAHRNIAYVITEVQATSAVEDVIPFLSCPLGASLLILNTIFYDRNNRPLAFGHNYIDDRRLRLRLVQAWT
ncbi:MAG: GntR family transcriptional regulator [Anaerolineales bacterium]|nr:GntR family transcriptional regulator [Anaerolineales bacterium]